MPTARSAWAGALPGGVRHHLPYVFLGDRHSPGPSISTAPPASGAIPWETARAHDVMDASGAFRPDDYISREEMAVMLVRALGYSTLAPVPVLPGPSLHRRKGNTGYIAIAYDIGMITGVTASDGSLRFLPHNSAKREEAAAMLVRVYRARYTSKIDWLHGFYAFSSLQPD